jgi:hypothetical protein
MDTTPVTKPKIQDTETVRPVAEKPIAQFSAFTDQFVKTMEGVSRLAEKGPSNFLLTLGCVLLIVALAMKLKLFGAEVSNLQPTEFITIVLAALLLLLGGSYLRFYQYVSHQKLGKEFSNKMIDMAEKAMGLAKTAVPAGQDEQKPVL